MATLNFDEVGEQKEQISQMNTAVGLVGSVAIGGVQAVGQTKGDEIDIRAGEVLESSVTKGVGAVLIGSEAYSGAVSGYSQGGTSGAIFGGALGGVHGTEEVALGYGAVAAGKGVGGYLTAVFNGAESGAVLGTEEEPGWGSLIGGVVGGLLAAFGGEKAVDAMNSALTAGLPETPPRALVDTTAEFPQFPSVTPELTWDGSGWTQGIGVGNAGVDAPQPRGAPTRLDVQVLDEALAALYSSEAQTETSFNDSLGRPTNPTDPRSFPSENDPPGSPAASSDNAGRTTDPTDPRSLMGENNPPGPPSAVPVNSAPSSVPANELSRYTSDMGGHGNGQDGGGGSGGASSTSGATAGSGDGPDAAGASSDGSGTSGIVEQCFNNLTSARRVAARHEKPAHAFLKVIDITAIRHWQTSPRPHSTQR